MIRFVEVKIPGSPKRCYSCTWCGELFEFDTTAELCELVDVHHADCKTPPAVRGEFGYHCDECGRQVGVVFRLEDMPRLARLHHEMVHPYSGTRPA